MLFLRKVKRKCWTRKDCSCVFILKKESWLGKLTSKDTVSWKHKGHIAGADKIPAQDEYDDALEEDTDLDKNVVN